MLERDTAHSSAGVLHKINEERNYKLKKKTIYLLIYLSRVEGQQSQQRHPHFPGLSRLLQLFWQDFKIFPGQLRESWVFPGDSLQECLPREGSRWQPKNRCLNRENLNWILSMWWRSDSQGCLSKAACISDLFPRSLTD